MSRITYKDLSDEITEKINAVFVQQNCFIDVLPGNVLLPRKFRDFGQSIRDLTIYADDVWLVSYPRSGSTWTQEMIWLLGNRLDFEGVKQLQSLRSPLLELSALYSVDHDEWVTKSIGNTVDNVRNMPRPRFTKTHMPWDLLPKDFQTIKPKIIYTARNPKDLCVSYYFYCKLVHGLKGSFEDFVELFLIGRVPLGAFWSHVLPFWKHRNDSNILFLKYEDMKSNLPKIVRKCAAFLNIDYKISEEDMQRICEYLKFEKMQKNPAVNLEPLLNNGNDIEIVHNHENLNGDGKFIRKGEIGDWKNYFSDDMSKRFDKWIEIHTAESDLVFQYEGNVTC